MKNLLTRLFNPKRESDLSQFEVYNVYSNESDAYIVKGVLETNGIKCFVEGDTLSSVYPSQLSFSGIRLYIRKGDFLMADNLLPDNLKN